jgi:pyruvate-ferredoxin/flavodoxin oxidoreductase
MSLKKSNPANADRMYAENAQNAKDHLAYLERLVSMYDSTNE